MAAIKFVADPLRKNLAKRGHKCFSKCRRVSLFLFVVVGADKGAMRRRSSSATHKLQADASMPDRIMLFTAAFERRRPGAGMPGRPPICPRRSLLTELVEIDN